MFRKQINEEAATEVFNSELSKLESLDEVRMLTNWRRELAQAWPIFNKASDATFCRHIIAIKIEIIGFAYTQYLIKKKVNTNARFDSAIKLNKLVDDYRQLSKLDGLVTAYNKAVGGSTGGNAMQAMTMAMMTQLDKSMGFEELSSYPGMPAIIVIFNKYFWGEFDRLRQEFEKNRVVT